jgi:hypothetical protein
MSEYDRQKLYEALCAIQNGTSFFDEILAFEFPQARPHVPVGGLPSQRALQLLQWAESQGQGVIDGVGRAVVYRAPAFLQPRDPLSLMVAPALASLQVPLTSPDMPVTHKVPPRATSSVRRVFVLGGVTQRAEGRTLEADQLGFLCSRLGARLADAKVELVICSPFAGSADVSTLMGYIGAAGPVVHCHEPNHTGVHRARETLHHRLGEHNTRIQLYQWPEPIIDDRMSSEEAREAWGEAWRSAQLGAMGECDVVVAIGGRTSGSAITTLREADRRGLPILPFTLLGGAAKYVWDTRPEGVLSTDGARLLGRPEGIDRVAELLNELVARRACPSRPVKAAFVSRATADQGYGEVVCKVLAENGIEVVLGERTKRSDRDVQAGIADAICNSDLFVAIWSGNFATSKWCIEELDLAITLRNNGVLTVWLFNLTDREVAHRAARQVDVAWAANAHELRNLVLARLATRA